MPTRTSAAHRRLLLRRLIEGGGISSQAEILRRLAGQGHVVSQTTVSRDLVAIGAHRESLDDTRVVYRLAAVAEQPDELQNRFRQFVSEISSSANLVVVRTPPGSAQPVAAALDDARALGRLPEALGAIAGDDTLLIVTRSATGGMKLARKLESMLES